jgi:hypothetical protein
MSVHTHSEPSYGRPRHTRSVCLGAGGGVTRLSLGRLGVEKLGTLARHAAISCIRSDSVGNP